MSKRARALVFGAMLAAMSLAGMTAVAQAQPPMPSSSSVAASGPPRNSPPPPRLWSGSVAASGPPRRSPRPPTTPGGRRPKPRWASPGASP
jgi:hypothetical protein